ncbi:cytochrome c oxidase, cbb3-type, subunit III [Lentisphaera araneosa HTCC2155]|uniref:Cytochrome c oxidase, cbb3-type, subunit III n=1 Tax=Lentisphaera araneosa HTCC2155 TaxID=313628 RepID=A6DIY6_9BACT|nr:c-type cytochrome [Lentisphaera araneosa]EDM28422.1 cytochrome c oxidase, cbb3-type, subunit III [Lentisphaera araneosa HTCC2155]
MNKTILSLLGLTLSVGLSADVKRGQQVFNQFCANCHGDKGQGLVGPNLTDKEILHGSSKEEIVKVIKNGVLEKAMPAWGTILNDSQISDVSDYVKSIIGKNLKNGFVAVKTTVSSFPTGTLEKPYLIRTYMPALDLDKSIFVNHGKGGNVNKYSPGSGKEDPKKVQKPINGLPSTITVNFGQELSYTFDTLECRLLYTWSGQFLDMTKYWGKGTGGGRRGFGYIPDIMGDVHFKTSGAHPFKGKVQFKGYRKEKGIPVFLYQAGGLSISLKITLGPKKGEAICEYRTNSKEPLKIKLPPGIQSSSGQSGSLILNAQQAQNFKLIVKGAK